MNFVNYSEEDKENKRVSKLDFKYDLARARK